MARDNHFVEIPVMEEDSEQKQIVPTTAATVQHHPLAEISRSPGHFLLLKLWQREEDLHGRRISRKEYRKDAFGREIFRLCCSFFVFHGLFFTLLFASSSHDRRCRQWWLPSAVSLCTSLALVTLVQTMLFEYWKVERRLQRDRAEGRALTRRVQELRMKGGRFDLSKGPQRNGKRMKSSSVEITWTPLAWWLKYRVTALLLCFSGVVLPAGRFILCG